MRWAAHILVLVEAPHAGRRWNLAPTFAKLLRIGRRKVIASLTVES